MFSAMCKKICFTVRSGEPPRSLHLSRAPERGDDSRTQGTQLSVLRKVIDSTPQQFTYLNLEK